MAATCRGSDLARATIVANTRPELVKVLGYLLNQQSDEFQIVSLSNKFSTPLWNGYRDINMNLSVHLGGGRSHICELQVHGCRRIIDVP